AGEGQTPFRIHRQDRDRALCPVLLCAYRCRDVWLSQKNMKADRATSARFKPQKTRITRKISVGLFRVSDSLAPRPTGSDCPSILTGDRSPSRRIVDRRVRPSRETGA